MRRSPFGPSLARGCTWCAGLGLTLLLSLPAPAQTAVPDTAPLARYIPRDDLGVYAEFDGVDAHTDAWKKTAAYRMLNETPLGLMLEDVGTQFVDQTLAKFPDRRLTGAEVVSLVKLALHSGFAFGANGKKESDAPASVVLVLRGAARKEVRTPVSKTLLSFAGKAGKPKLATKGERSIAVMPTDTRAEGWAWWAEKDDVVVVLDKPETADVVIEVLDGKRPSATEQPTRAALANADNGFVPVGLAFVDLAYVSAPNGASDKVKEQLAGVQRVDYRWGFQDNALMTVWRLVAPAPRQGALALFDGPKFDLKSIPPMPDSVEGFTTFSLDPAKTLDQLVALSKAASPEAGDKVDEAVTTLKSKYKIDLRKDVLAQLGPKMTFFVTPGKLTAAASTGSEKAEPAAGGVPNPVTMMLAAVPIPKFAFVIEVKNGTAFGKKLDELMIAANKMLRESAKPAAAGGGEGAAAPAERKRGGSAAAAVPKFDVMAGKAKAYAFVLPPEMGKLPAGVRPTIRVGEKFVAIGVNPAAAGQALEAKETWKPTGDYVAALESVPADLVFLTVSDPRGTMPQELASLPRTIQSAFNLGMQGAAAGATPGAPAGSSAPGVSGPGSSSYPGAVPGGSSSSSSSLSSSSSSSPPPGYPQQPGAPGSGSGAAGGGAMVIKVDPSRMPSADALKAFLFPGYTALSVNDQEIRLVTREAFPNIASGGGMTSSPATSMLLGPALQKAREAAMKQAAQAKGSTTPSAPGEKPK